MRGRGGNRYGGNHQNRHRPPPPPQHHYLPQSYPPQYNNNHNYGGYPPPLMEFGPHGAQYGCQFDAYNIPPTATMYPQPHQGPPSYHQEPQPAPPPALSRSAPRESPKHAAAPTVGSGFSRVYPVDEKVDKLLTEAILQRNQDITPTPSDQAYVSALMSKIQAQLEGLILDPSSFEPCQIEEIKQVGSYKTQTMIREKNQADVVVVFKTLPTKEAVQALMNKLITDYRAANRNEWVQATMLSNGFDISTRQASLRLLIATVPMNLRLLDDSVHMPTREIIERHLAAIRHVKWFDENANNASVRALVRILRDMRHRFSGLTGMNSWMLTLLANHALTSSSKASETNDNPSSGGGQLALASAFRRCLQLMAGGIFLPGAAGIPDPCQTYMGNGPVVSVHDSLTLEEMDQVTFTAQTLLRVNAHGGSRNVLGLEGDNSIASDMSIFSSIVVTASEAAYDHEEQMQWLREDEEEILRLHNPEMDDSEGIDAEENINSTSCDAEMADTIHNNVAKTCDLFDTGDTSAVVVKSEK